MSLERAAARQTSVFTASEYHCWDGAEWVQPFKVDCIRNAITSECCQRYDHAHDKCEPVTTLVS
ncbi:hypothetical protein N7501_006675 [Penicillium viridicatum]|nr:hypothetical protein N7501_006675 [Penicillium viridicatum]